MKIRGSTYENENAIMAVRLDAKGGLMRPTAYYKHATKYDTEKEAKAAVRKLAVPGTDVYPVEYKTKKYRMFVWKAVGRSIPPPSEVKFTQPALPFLGDL